MPDRLLLCTDLDRTLIPNGTEPESPGARHHFAVLARDSRTTLAYISGRHRELVQHAIAEYSLPLPRYVIGDVGTTIYQLAAGGDWTPLQGWREHIARDWRNTGHQDLSRTLENFDDLRLQEDEKQNRHKLSYYVSRSAEREQLLAAIGDILTDRGIRARLIWSIDEASNCALLDILPSSASKHLALVALQSWEKFTDSNTVFSGDSGNDMDILSSSIPSTLVANSSTQVQREAHTSAMAAGNSDKLYLARGELMGMNGNYSAGILEGVAHYHPECIEWMGFEQHK